MAAARLTAAEAASAARKRLARATVELELARRHPLYLCSHMVGVDQRDGSRFSLEHLRYRLKPGEVQVEGHHMPGQSSWRWQRYVAERVLEAPRLIVGKGRQIGVTWVVLAVDVAEAVLSPGTVSLLYRQREDEAIDNLKRWWALYRSLPPYFTEHIKVVKPDRASQPGESGIVLEFPSGEQSEIVPMTSSASSGHGRSVRAVLLDEGAHIEKLAEIRAAVEPAAGRAKIRIVSTARGRANLETGEGNEFHRLWVVAEQVGYERLFLAYDVHPDRDEEWYATAPEVQSLKERQRNEQYPRNEHEAFKMTAGLWFDEDVLQAYAERVRPPLERKSLKAHTAQVAEWRDHPRGPLKIFARPRPDHSYGIAVDPATGSGRDFAAAYVIDLAEMELVAEYHARIAADLLARDMHFLGRFYAGSESAAEIMVETTGGYGDAVIAHLRDAAGGRRPYPRMYRHVMSSRPDRALAKPYGFPTSTKTRPLILAGLDRALREGDLPYVSNDLLFEMENFVGEPPPDAKGSKRGPWPRAADGFHDDRVLACAMALELYRLRGAHPETKPGKPKRRKQKRVYPWVKPMKGRKHADSR